MHRFRKPHLVLFAGPNGSGKTTLYYEKFANARLEQAEYVNADEYTADSGSEVAGGRKAILRREQLIASSTSFVTETTLAGRTALRLLNKSVAKGFLTTVIYVCTSSPEINIQRVAQRVKSGGHHVPADVIVRRYYDSLKNLHQAISVASSAHAFSSDGATTRVFSALRGRVSLRSESQVPSWVPESVLST